MNGITGLVLCGGQSKRMGADKGSLPFGGETMLERVTRILRSISTEVLIVGRRDQPTVTVHDSIENEGPLAGLAAGLAASKSDVNLVVACDMPLINPAVLQRMVTLIGEADICVAVNDGHASALCGVYRSSVAPIAQSMFEAGERRVMPMLDRVQTKRVDAAIFRDIDPDLNTFKSLDTPEAYQKALNLVIS